MEDIILDFKLPTRIQDDVTEHDFGRLAERWKRRRKLGAGGFGDVWLEAEESTQKYRAVKIIRPVPGVDFRKELWALEKFSRPKYRQYFVEFHGWFEYPMFGDVHICLAMEYFELGDLRNYAKACNGSFTEDEALLIARQIAAGLEVFHTARYAHRDLKLENIFVQSPFPDCRVKIGDFGLAKQDVSTLLTIAGTPRYLAPEQIDDSQETEAYDNKVDLWALGHIVFELVTGQHAFTDWKQLRRYCDRRIEFPRQPLETKLMSKAGISFIVRLMDQDPSERPSALECFTILEAGVRNQVPNLTSHIVPLFRESIDILEEDRLLSTTVRNIPNGPTKKSTLSTVVPNISDPPLESQLTTTRRHTPEVTSERFVTALIVPSNKERTQLSGKRQSDTTSAAGGPSNAPSIEVNKSALLPSAKEEVALDTSMQGNAFRSGHNTLESTSKKLPLRGTVRNIPAVFQQDSTLSTVAHVDLDSPLEDADAFLVLRSNEEKALRDSVERANGSESIFDTSGEPPEEHGTALLLPSNLNEGLLEAVKLNNDRMVLLLLENGADVNYSGVPGTSLPALHQAIIYSFESIVRLLLSKGASPNTCNQAGLTPLYESCAVDEPNESIIRLLLGNGAEVNKPSVGDRFTALHSAAIRDKMKLVQLLIESGADVNIATTEGVTALHYAAEQGHMEILEFLLENGAFIDIATYEGWTALHFAAREGHKNIAEVLLAHGAAVETATTKGWTALQIVAQHGHEDIVELLLREGAAINSVNIHGWTALHEAARSGHVRIVGLLLRKGSAIDVPTNNGMTPLYCAAMGGMVDTVETLLKQGADVNGNKRSEVTPLYKAAYNGHDNVVKLLLNYGSNVNFATADKGCTALHVAVNENHSGVVELLLQHGADVNAVGDKWTALHYAANQGFEDIAGLLLQSKAAINAPTTTTSAWTPLHMGIKEDHAGVVTLLVKNGANVNLATGDGWTPLHFAARYSTSHVVQLLLENRADVKAVTNDGQAALDIASAQHQEEIVKLLGSRLPLPPSLKLLELDKIPASSSKPSRLRRLFRSGG